MRDEARAAEAAVRYEWIVPAETHEFVAAGQSAHALVERIRGALDVQAEPETAVDRTFFDTFDWRVHRAGGSLSLDHDHRPPTISWRPGESTGTTRSADSTATPGPAAGQAPGPAAAPAPPLPPPTPTLPPAPTTAPAPPGLHARRGGRFFAGDLPPGPLRARVERVAENRALLPLVRVRSRVRRLRVLNADGKTVARIEVDDPRVVGAGAAAVRPHVRLDARARIVPVRGYPRAAERAEGALRDLGLIPDATAGGAGGLLTAAVRATGRKPGDYSPKFSVPLQPFQPASEAVRTILRSLFDAMLANEAGVKADIDSEFLHDFRVAVRRTRSALRELRTALPPDDVARFREEFRWLGDITTPCRDLDVYVLAVDDFRAALSAANAAQLDPLEALLRRRQGEAHAELVRAMRTARYRSLRADWAAFLVAPPSEHDGQQPDAGRPAIEVASRRIRKVHRRVLAHGDSITADSPSEVLHDLRKRCKELRYLLEFFAALYPRDGMSVLIRELKALQDNLGDFQDLEVQSTSLTGYGHELVDAQASSASPAATLMAMGLLVDHLQRRQRKARAEFAEHFAGFGSESNRALVKELFAG